MGRTAAACCGRARCLVLTAASVMATPAEACASEQPEGGSAIRLSPLESANAVFCDGHFFQSAACKQCECGGTGGTSGGCQQLLLAWWRAAADGDPAVVPPDAADTLIATPQSIQAALRALSASRFFAGMAFGR